MLQSKQYFKEWVQPGEKELVYLLPLSLLSFLFNFVFFSSTFPFVISDVLEAGQPCMEIILFILTCVVPLVVEQSNQSSWVMWYHNWQVTSYLNPPDSKFENAIQKTIFSHSNILEELNTFLLSERGFSRKGMLPIPDVRHHKKPLKNYFLQYLQRDSQIYINDNWSLKRFIKCYFYLNLLIFNFLVLVIHTIFNFSNFGEFFIWNLNQKSYLKT